MTVFGCFFVVLGERLGRCHYFCFIGEEIDAEDDYYKSGDLVNGWNFAEEDDCESETYAWGDGADGNCFADFQSF